MITDDIRLLWLCDYACNIRTGPVGANHIPGSNRIILY